MCVLVKCLQNLEDSVRSMDLDLQETMSHPMWAIGRELKSFTRAVSICNH